MSHTIELKKVSKYYAGEDTVSMGFNRVDLELDIGEFVVITGESGSGKSTLLNVISGLDTYDEGEMFVCGEDTTAYSTEDYERYRKTYIGNIFQDFNLVNSYTVYQNIELVMLLSGKKKSECRDRVNELIHMVGLDEYSKTKASRLSGGQKQRVAIARALAKDAPVIVADEPTGNLDSESAESVMKTLSEVSQDKLVIIVTHNYEQAEPYATRKLTMHDGKIIEDKIVRDVTPKKQTVEENELTDEGEGFGSSNMGKKSELLLGTRNTFNLASKFILLFIVYLFVSTAVLGQYASTKNNIHQNDIMGNNNLFLNDSVERLILTKDDKSAFSEQDIKKISKIANICRVVENDLSLDSNVTIKYKDVDIECNICNASELNGGNLTYGRTPVGRDEIAIKTDLYSENYQYIVDNGKKLLGKKVNIKSTLEDTDITNRPVSIVGVIIDSGGEEYDVNYFGKSTVFVSDALDKEIMSTLVGMNSDIEIDYGEKIASYDTGRTIYVSDKVEEGKAFIFSSHIGFFADRKAIDKNIKIHVHNPYFDNTVGVTVAQEISEDNMEDVIGIKKKQYEDCKSRVYLNIKDYTKLFGTESYQISAFMEDELLSDVTIKDIESQGYSVFALKESLSDVTGGYRYILKMLSALLLIAVLLALFFISYAVIKLIMKSRDSYYSIIRMLGATQKNMNTIIRCEMLIVMSLTYAIDMTVVVLTRCGIIDNPVLKTYLQFISPYDYLILAVVLVVMTVLVANRYSRKCFSNSAMGNFRGEA